MTPTASNTKSVELLLQSMAQRLSPEWCVRAVEDFSGCVLRIERLVAELDETTEDIEWEYQTYTHPICTPENNIDYLKTWLVKTFPLMTAPAWQPHHKLVYEKGLTPVEHVKKTVVNKVVAAPCTRRFNYVKY